MPVIYTLIARAPSSVLIDSTNPAHTGNFSDISKKILAHIPEEQQTDHKKVTFVFEGHTFNFRAERGLMFMCMCDAAFGRSQPFAFLKDVIDTFFLMFAGDETALEGSTARSFRAVLTQKIKNYSEAGAAKGAAGGSLSASLLSADAAAAALDSEARLAKMAHVSSEVKSLATSAMQGLDKVIGRGTAIEGLMDRTDHLTASAVDFKTKSKKLNQRLCWENLKLKLLMAAAILVALYLVLSVYCGMDLRKCI